MIEISREREKTRLFSSRLITFAVFALLSADWCLTSRCTKQKKSAFSVWRAKHANERRIRAQEPGRCGRLMKCGKRKVNREEG